MIDRKVRARYLRAYADADGSAKLAGAQWYRESRGAAEAIAQDSGVSLEVAAGVIAALSPRVQWRANVRNAADACAGRPYGALGNSKRAAARIIAGEHPLEVLGGLKTRAFFQAITGDDDAAVIDVWMLRAAGDDPAKGATRARYGVLADTLRSAARKVGVPTADFQAIIWTHVRGSAE
jgi:hypothetical protein